MKTDNVAYIFLLTCLEYSGKGKKKSKMKKKIKEVYTLRIGSDEFPVKEVPINRQLQTSPSGETSWLFNSVTEDFTVHENMFVKNYPHEFSSLEEAKNVVVQRKDVHAITLENHDMYTLRKGTNVGTADLKSQLMSSTDEKTWIYDRQSKTWEDFDNTFVYNYPPFEFPTLDLAKKAFFKARTNEANVIAITRELREDDDDGWLCDICKKEDYTATSWIQCDRCDSMYHTACVNKDDESRESFVCHKCERLEEKCIKVAKNAMQDFWNRKSAFAEFVSPADTKKRHRERSLQQTMIAVGTEAIKSEMNLSTEFARKYAGKAYETALSPWQQKEGTF